MTSTHVLGVLDLTFLDLEEEADLEKGINERGIHVLPNSPLRKAAVSASTTFSGAETASEMALALTATGSLSPGSPSSGSPVGSPSRRKKQTTREEVKALRLGNNNISLLSILSTKTLTHRIDTTKVLWIDLSFNNLEKIASDFAETFPSLTTLHLQANKIAKLSQIKKLGSLKHLKSLAMYGNPVEENKHYRNFVLHTCAALTQFDASPVCEYEKKRMKVWEMTFRRKLTPEED